MTLQGEHLTRPTYAFLHTLDEGNTATCILARHSIFDCDVVQKTISTHAVPDGIANEPALLKEVEHERIVKVWEAQWDPDPALSGMNAITFICPYYEGGSIYSGLVDGHVFRTRDAIQFADDILCALDFLNSEKLLLHRDLKPANIMLSADRRRAFLGDLGSAVRIASSTGTAEARGGSALYLAPEGSSTGYVSAKSDLYSLGLLLIEVLNGRFRYEDLDPIKIRDRLHAGKRSLPDAALQPAPWVPLALASFVRGLSAADLERRPRNAATALRNLRDIRVVDWARTSGFNLTGTWVGYWPPENSRSEQRIYELNTVNIAHGIHKGNLKASLRWRKPQGSWRNIPRLNAYIAETDGALRTFFRSAEAFAQTAPAP